MSTPAKSERKALLVNYGRTCRILVTEVEPYKKLLKRSWLADSNKPIKEKSSPYVQRLSAEEMNYYIKRSRSLDLSCIRRESYLARWSRETTPIDSQDDYRRRIRRSYTPVREVGDYRFVEDPRRQLSAFRPRTPLGVVTTPYHTNVHYYQEEQPIRKYDLFSVRTWAYPIHKYLHSRDYSSSRPYSFSRVYGNTALYTPPTMAAEPRLMTTRRGYSGYTYAAAEHSYDIASRPRSLNDYHFWRSHVASSPWYWTYYGNSGLRHYNSYRPRAYTSRLSTYWTPYY